MKHFAPNNTKFTMTDSKIRKKMKINSKSKSKSKDKRKKFM